MRALRHVVDDDALVPLQSGAAGCLLAVHFVEEVEEGRVETPLRVNPQQITLEQLDVAHLGTGDLDSCIKDLVQQQRKIAALQKACTHLLHARHLFQALAQLLLSLLTRRDVVEAIDGSGDLAALRS